MSLYPDADRPPVLSLAELAGHLDPPGGRAPTFLLNSSPAR